MWERASARDNRHDNPQPGHKVVVRGSGVPAAITDPTHPTPRHQCGSGRPPAIADTDTPLPFPHIATYAQSLRPLTRSRADAGRRYATIATSEEPATPETPRASNAAFVFLILTAFINSMGFGLPTPVMPALVMELADTDLANAALWGGAATFIYAIMQFIFSPIIGALSDRYGRRPVLLLSLVAFAVDLLVLALVNTIWGFLVIRAFAGIFASTFSTTNAYVADITPRDKRAQRFALIGAAFGGGFILGPAIGGVLGEIDIRLPFFAGAALAAANAVFGYFVVRESLPTERRRAFSWKRANTFGTLSQLFRTTGVAALLPVFFFATLSSWVYPTVWNYVAIEKFAWDERAIGFSIAYYGVIAFVAQAVVIQLLLPKLGIRRAIWIALVVESISLAAIGIATEGWMVYALLTLALISLMQEPAIRQELSNRTPEDAQGELQGGLSALASIVMIVSPVLYNGMFRLTAGDNATLYFPGSPFVVAAALSLLTLLLYLAAIRRPSPDEAPASG